MVQSAIRIDGIGKEYRLGLAAERSDNFRDALIGLAKAPLRRLRRLGSRIGAEESFWALRDVSFDVQPGEVVGLIGRNGAGKSTLLKILSRITQPTEGRASIHGRVGSLLEVGTGFHRELSGRENIFLNGAILGMRKTEIESKFDEIVDFAGIEKFIDTPVKRYSSGMYVRLAFAVAAHLEPEILLVDEVLAVGDMAFRKRCLGKMGEVARSGRTVIFVSHNMAAVQSLCTTAAFLAGGRLTHFGDLERAIELYEGQVISEQHSGDHPPHVLYDADADEPIRVSRLEALTPAGEPMPLVRTGDAVTFRLHYRADRRVPGASAVLMFSTQHGVCVQLCATSPDSALPMTIEPGEHHVDCSFEEFPLSAGRFSVGAGLAVPDVEWLFRRDNLAALTVHAGDVLQSGRPQQANRALINVPHRWAIDP